MSMQYFHAVISTFLFLTYFMELESSPAHDIVVNNTNHNSTWKSLLFMFPVDIAYNHLFSICRARTNYYCLLGYATDYDLESIAVSLKVRRNVRSSDPAVQQLQFMKSTAERECRSHFKHIYRKHNFIFKDGCSERFYFPYFSFGFIESLFTLKEYYERLTDYSENDKRLNFIMAFYSPVCEANVIMELGFGIGDLKRPNQFEGYRTHRPGLSYILKVGSQWTPRIPYENPEDFLIFSWFKKNLICAAQPWICGKPKIRFKKGLLWWQKHFGKKPQFA